MILADVGNRHIHLYEEGRVLHLDTDDAIGNFGERIVHYISVSQATKERLVRESYWRDISAKISLPGAYEGMGVDRRALCLSRGDGIYVDAGSALTVDRVVEGMYRGGFILPGLHAYRRAFAELSPALDLESEWPASCDTPPKGTREQLGYGIIAPIVHEIERLRESLPLYVTGGDGRLLASYLAEAVFSETLVFEGMMNALRSN
ncbi:type III pantothenate kinase [Nitratifractor sp.]|uniref:type III pantothenate kinase n=1 Tax=Nitratifractor sp. TaxID=2268144 RepID=UPI0025E12C36|nr:type III pantothenate kinase [Nitratifractor sp.]